MRSEDAAAHLTQYQTTAATPMPVRAGALRGRSSRWCSVLSLVIHRSIQGQAHMPTSRTPTGISGTSTPMGSDTEEPHGIGMFQRKE